MSVSYIFQNIFRNTFQRFIIAGFLGYILLQPGQAQPNSFSLEDCLSIAFEHNIDLKSAQLQSASSRINVKQAKFDFLPSIGANYSLGINNGRNINPATNDFINEKLNFSNVGMGFDATLFNGFRLKNALKQQKSLEKAAEMETEAVRQNLSLIVTHRYIQLLTANAQLKLAQARMETTHGQLTRLKARFEEGEGNPADYSDMQGQYAQDELGVLNAQNSYKEATLALFVVLGIEPDLSATFAPLAGYELPENYPFSADEVYQQALQSQAGFLAQQARIQAASSALKVAKSRYFPEISLFGQISSNYSSVSKALFETGTDVKETGDFVSLNSQALPVFTRETIFKEENIGYIQQFNNNLNSVVGLAVRIPIFDRFQAKNDVSLRKIELQASTLDLQNTKLQFQQAIQDAYVKMETAFSRYHVLEIQVKSFESSYEIHEIRFTNGISNMVEYLNSKNNLDNARVNLANARFEYLLRIKILDYYRGLYQ